jgi:hypothetical protein
MGVPAQGDAPNPELVDFTRRLWISGAFAIPLLLLSMGPMPLGLAGQFVGALVLSHYFWVVAALQIAGGALLMVNRFVPLGLVLLGPVIVNILLYHVFLNSTGIGLAIVVAILWLIVFYAHRQYFSGLFVQRA